MPHSLDFLVNVARVLGARCLLPFGVQAFLELLQLVAKALPDALLPMPLFLARPAQSPQRLPSHNVRTRYSCEGRYASLAESLLWLPASLLHSLFASFRYFSD